MKNYKNKLGASGIGGQAVLEGIMMQSEGKYAVAVRTSDHLIHVDTQHHKGIGSKSKILSLPFIRGIFKFIDSMVLGVKTLTDSAKFFDDEDKVAEDKLAVWMKTEFGEKAEKILMGLTVALSLVCAITLFMVLPLFVADMMERYVSWVRPSHVPIIEGVVKIVLFILYLLAISLMKDIRRTFMYHGAEHKCINCIENGKILNVENVRNSSRFHKRCGTSFIFVVLMLSIVLFLLIQTDTIWLRYLIRILLIPVIAGVSYEFIKKAGISDNKIIMALSKPGMWMQKITTKEPTDDMIEVAIVAVEAVFDWKEYLRQNGIDVFDKQREESKKAPLPKGYRKDRKGSGYNWKF